jgi:hypothetical protein
VNCPLVLADRTRRWIRKGSPILCTLTAQFHDLDLKLHDRRDHGTGQLNRVHDVVNAPVRKVLKQAFAHRRANRVEDVVETVNFIAHPRTLSGVC